MKKFISLLTCSAMLFSSLTAFANTAELATEDIESFASEKASAVNEPTSEKLEEVIKKVRPLIDVPEEFEEFSWDFNDGSYYSLPSWNLSWTDGETGEVFVRCDSEGRITSFSRYNYNKPYGANLPQNAPDAFLDTALAFIKKTAPYIADTQLVADALPITSLFSNTYTYRFTRYENGIPVPDNTVSVTVNHNTGEVESFGTSFANGIEFNSEKPAITPEKAKEILSENQKMVLSYRLKSEYDEETGKLKSRNAFLVYTPEKSYISVDAYTGKVYTERNTWFVNEKGGGMGSSSNNKLMMDSAVTEESASAVKDAGYRYQLTEKELEQLGVLDSLISKDEAIAVITKNDALYIDKNATAVSATLNKDYGDEKPIILKSEDGSEKEEEQYVWNITFTAPSSESSKYSYSRMYAVVDANDGTLISYSATLPDHWYYTENKLEIPKLNYSFEQAQKIAESFLEDLQPEKFESSRLTDSWEHSPIKYVLTEDGKSNPVYGVKTFRFTRVNEGIDFTYNNLSCDVDLVSGKITQYSYSWYDDIEFESPKNVISDKEALNALYSYDGFGINYEVNSDYTYNKYLLDVNKGEYIDYNELYETNTYSRAVYSAYAPGTTVIRAADGVMIYYSGEEYKKTSAYVYSDIQGHWAEETIKRFSYAGIGFEGEKFMPDSTLTGDELTQLFQQARLYAYSDSFTLGEGNVTRADAVKYIITALGYYEIALLRDVFITDFADNTDLLAEDVGFIAIAKGFKIVDGDGNTFRPYDKLTRAEALELIKKVIDSSLLKR